MDVKQIIIIFLLAISFDVFASKIANIDNLDISLDGNLDEKVWQLASTETLSYEIWPSDNAATNSDYETVIKIFENGKVLYIGIDAKDPNPSQIRANYYKRDSSRGDDTISIAIDTFNQSQRAYVFQVNPLGGQSDFIMLDRDEVSWDGYWSSKGVITDSGFQLEIAIPLDNFRFPSQSLQQWKIDIRRKFQRDNRYTLSMIPVDRDNDCTLCQYKVFELFQNAKANQKLELRPYAIWTSENNKEYPYNGSFTNNQEKEVGVDIKWAPSGSQILNATFNPDFSQVEADDAQFSVNRQFSVFYEEKRNFFLEGHENFTTPLNLVHTRNIVDPDYGIKYTGKHGGHVLGAFIAEDSITNYIRPGSQSDEFLSLDEESDNLAFRYRYDITDVGHVGLLTTQRRSDSYENDVLSFDAFLRPTEKSRVAVQYVDSDTFDNGLRSSGDAIHLKYNYNAAADWHWLGYKKIDSDFSAGMGFISQVGFEEAEGGIGHLWENANKNGNWHRVYLSYSGQIKKPLEEENILTDTLYEQHSVELNIDGKNRLDFYLTPSVIKQFYEGIEHDLNRLYVSIDYELFDNSTFGFWSITGDGIDFSQNQKGDRETLGIWANSVINSQLNLSAEILRNSLDAQNANVFTENIFNLTANYSLDFKHHLRLKLQTGKVEYGDTSFSTETSRGYQFLYLYQVSAYTSVYAGYSSNFREDNQIGSLEEYNNYSFIKFNHVFNL